MTNIKFETKEKEIITINYNLIIKYCKLFSEFEEINEEIIPVYNITSETLKN